MNVLVREAALADEVLDVPDCVAQVRCVARQQAIKTGKALTQREMTVLVEELFGCETPNVTPNGSPTYLEFKADYLERMFGK